MTRPLFRVQVLPALIPAPASRRARLASATAGLLLSLLPGAVAHAGPAEEDYGFTVSPSAFTVSPGAGAAVGRRLVLWSTGAASTFVTTTSPVRQVRFAVDPQACEGAPHLEVAVDGQTVLSQEILAGPAYPGDAGGDYAVPVTWQPGRHKLTFRFLDDHRTSVCDRNLRLADITVSSWPELLTRQNLASSGVVVSPATAGEAGAPERPWDGVAKLWNNGSLGFRLDSQRSKELAVTFTGVVCAGWTAHVRVVMDGEVLLDGQLPHQFVLSGRTYGYLEVDRDFADGPHAFAIAMSRDLRTSTCDRNLIVEDLYFTSLPQDYYPSTTGRPGVVRR